MTILELHTLLQPLINFLGTICLIGLVAGGALMAIAWLIRKLWKVIVTFSTVSFVLCIALLVLSGI